MQLVGSALARYVHETSGGSPILRLIAGGLYTKLGDRFLASGEQSCAALKPVRHVGLINARCVNSVESELIVNAMLTIEGHICDKVAARNCTRSEKAEPGEVSTIDGKFMNLGAAQIRT